MKAVLLLMCLMLVSCYKADPLKATVMITNLALNSGGSGTILDSSDDGSVILTNGHVCDVAKSGGVVHTEDGLKPLITAYKKSNAHDLCLIYVRQNLHAHADLAIEPPKMLDYAVILGHPHLLPTVSTKGQFSGHQVIQVTMGMRECTKEETQDPELGFFCALVGGLPIMKTYEAQIISSLIQPGSSGSAVYNSRGEIASVAFAGNGDIGFAFAVPYEYVRYFLTKELSHLPTIKPSAEVSFLDRLNRIKWNSKLEEVCQESTSLKVITVCKGLRVIVNRQ